VHLHERTSGCLIGTAIGDSLLLPAEGLSRARIARRFPGPLRHRLVCGRGLVSDDTEHAFLTAQALLAAGPDAAVFARALARRLRWWLVALPGGCGKATALGLIRSWLGFPPARSGVRSAGNGPAMRAALIGVRWSHDPVQRRAFVTASTVLTHRDDQALTAALAVAESAALVTRGEPVVGVWSIWRGISADAAWQDRVAMLERHHCAGDPVDAVAIDLGCPDYVSGYALHSVPLALYAWLRHRADSSACFESILRCGGDTDTMGAIAGALLGTERGVAAFPAAWLERIADWPLSIGVLSAAGQAFAAETPRPVGWWWPCQPLRNLVFLGVILAHGLRRLLP